MAEDKMTPRTDSALYEAFGRKVPIELAATFRGGHGPYQRFIELAGDLERENVALRNALLDLLAAVDADSRVKKRDYYYERKAALAALKME